MLRGSWENVSGFAPFFHSVGVETVITVLVTLKESSGFKKCKILSMKGGFNDMNVSSSSHVWIFMLRD